MTLSSEFLNYVPGDVSSLTKIMNQIIVIPEFCTKYHREAQKALCLKHYIRKGDGSSRHGGCCHYYYDIDGIGGHHHEAEDWEDIVVWNFRSD